MEDEPLQCPGCGGALQRGQVAGCRQYTCQRCQSAVLTMPVLRQLEGRLAQQMWMADDGASEATERCPFCRNPMHPKDVGKGRVSVCRGCEAVWLDQEAYEALPANQAPGAPPSLASQSLRCPQCGAPVANTWDEHCAFCRAALHPPTKVVILPSAVLTDEYRPRTVLGQLVHDLTEDRRPL